MEFQKNLETTMHAIFSMDLKNITKRLFTCKTPCDQMFLDDESSSLVSVCLFLYDESLSLVPVFVLLRCRNFMF